MKQISLTQGLITLVDDEDFKYLSQFKWHITTGFNGKRYAVRYKDIRMHREIMKAPKNKLVDHIDGDTFNNQKSNLRICTKGENNRNVSVRKDNKFGFKGVNYRVSHRKFRAYISTGEKILHLGYYETPIEAAKAYNEAAIKYHGEFAGLNVI